MIERERAPEAHEEESSATDAVPRIAVSAAKDVRCPYCHGGLAKDMLAARCEICSTAHHATCFAERGACSVHGCRGRAARVAAVAASSERQAYAACRACSGTIFLDERAALCRKCDSAHHPSCLEVRGSCARCGSRDATLMAATELARAAAEVKRLHARSALPAIATGFVLLAASVFAGFLGNREICVLLGLCSIAEFALGLLVLGRSAKVARAVFPDAAPRRGSR